MKRKIYYIFILLIILEIVIGLGINNIVLNRNIYSNEIHMKASEVSYRNKINKYNLDDMEKKLDLLEDKMDNPEKYQSDDTDIVFKVYVPRFRILFSMNPLDLRFETKNYKVYLNNSIMRSIENEITYISNIFAKLLNNITDNLGNSDKKFNNVKSQMTSFKEGIYPRTDYFNTSNFFKSIERIIASLKNDF
ncbi:hypothetical protein OSC52_12395 [Clostridium pasteurianum]|uniref:hypothetical protein n=1 Tax=Clostridium pasteurianum TaxID=1501 RepID=UPI00226095D1|nr:hypothetical protein [Clostridium pasteurianum]UZW12654.1 hypothetical protein OSC52_12395 [Clostridium pasteurianum]